jgi:shikimate kinase
VPLIFLIGYRGSGKSTVGRVLAGRLGWEFVDADQVLEDRYGKTIREIFAAEGETGFRNKESAVLADLCTRTTTVIATGGGVILRQENRARIKNCGFVAWLSADPETLWERMQGDPTTAARRPPLTTGGLIEVQELLAAREPWYKACAHVEVPAAALSPEQAADAILAAWSSHSPRSSG